MLTVTHQAINALDRSGSLSMTAYRQTAAPPRPDLQTRRVKLADGAATTIQVACFDRSLFGARVVRMDPKRKLADWCGENEAPDALIGGFYVRGEGLPLGELRIDGRVLDSRPFDSPVGHSARVRPLARRRGLAALAARAPR